MAQYDKKCAVFNMKINGGDTLTLWEKKITRPYY
jgi:hypothetical protein